MASFLRKARAREIIHLLLVRIISASIALSLYLAGTIPQRGLAVAWILTYSIGSTGLMASYCIICVVWCVSPELDRFHAQQLLISIRGPRW